MSLKITTTNFEETIAEGYTFVDFYADWCGPCKMLGPIIEELSTDFEGKVKIGKLDIDANQDIAQRFGVMSIPTMILFKDGEPVEKIQGFQPKQSLEKYLQSKL